MKYPMPCTAIVPAGFTLWWRPMVNTAVLMLWRYLQYLSFNIHLSWGQSCVTEFTYLRLPNNRVSCGVYGVVELCHVVLVLILSHCIAVLSFVVMMAARIHAFFRFDCSVILVQYRRGLTIARELSLK